MLSGVSMAKRMANMVRPRSLYPRVLSDMSIAQALHSEGFGQKAERNKKKNGLPTKEEASREKRSWGKKVSEGKVAPLVKKKAKKAPVA